MCQFILKWRIFSPTLYVSKSLQVKWRKRLKRQQRKCADYINKHTLARPWSCCYQSQKPTNSNYKPAVSGQPDEWVTQPPIHCNKELLFNALTAAVNYQARCNDKVVQEIYHEKNLTLASVQFQHFSKAVLQRLPLRVIENKNLLIRLLSLLAISLPRIAFITWQWFWLHIPTFQQRYIVLDYFSHNSPGNKARNVFKPSTDSASLLVSIKKFFDLGLGFSVGDITMRACFCLFGQLYLTLGANPTSHFWVKFVFGN